MFKVAMRFGSSRMKGFLPALITFIVVQTTLNSVAVLSVGLPVFSVLTLVFGYLASVYTLVYGVMVHRHFIGEPLWQGKGSIKHLFLQAVVYNAIFVPLFALVMLINLVLSKLGPVGQIVSIVLGMLQVALGAALAVGFSHGRGIKAITTGLRLIGQTWSMTGVLVFFGLILSTLLGFMQNGLTNTAVLTILTYLHANVIVAIFMYYYQAAWHCQHAEELQIEENIAPSIPEEVV